MDSLEDGNGTLRVVQCRHVQSGVQAQQWEHGVAYPASNLQQVEPRVVTPL